MNANYSAISPSPTLGIVSLALGVIGVFAMVPALLIWICGIIPFVLGIAAVIVGILAVSRVKRDPARNSGKGLAIAGVLVGLLAIILPILWTAITIGLYMYLGMSKPPGRFF